ncbi:Dynamitin-domain-containing protein [Schizophyllum amplum]|uniref:Dynamitin-domain-containing protein n=1 Tax=Schizophyllum amplum TaxID=97359 RepID=A0A550CY38_9AGAR|nr:Dynamitin-domain-containing protein [Auriculariopsis ampla]
MSSTKYANLPDIDTAPDIYETEESFNPAIASSPDDDEDEVPSRSRMRSTADSAFRHTNPDELDSRTITPEDAQKKFRKAEQRRDRIRSRYTYPPSPSRSRSRSRSKERPLPISKRLLNIQAELESLEAEVNNSAKDKLQADEDIDPGELIRGLTDVRKRLGQIRKDKEGRGRLVEVITAEEAEKQGHDPEAEAKERTKKADEKPEVRSVVEMDKRVGELEKLVGTSTTVLDETNPLPAPLLPMLGRLHSQLTLLTQPRHIDSISRRLKVLLTDLDRASQAQHGHRRQHSQSKDQTQPPAPAPLSEQLLPLLTRLSPALPHIPHILTRLRTLSQLHTSAAEFQSTMEGLEEEQRKMRETLNELESAVASVEGSLKENRDLVKGNVEGLDKRVDDVVKRLELLQQ